MCGSQMLLKILRIGYQIFILTAEFSAYSITCDYAKFIRRHIYSNERWN